MGLERTLYQVSEDVGVVEVCAILYGFNDSISCPINFAFDVSLSTSFSMSGGSAGDGHYYIHTQSNYD